jgi:hypothetical protein
MALKESGSFGFSKKLKISFMATLSDERDAAGQRRGSV